MNDKTEMLPPHIFERNKWRSCLEAHAQVMQAALARDPGVGPELRALIESLPDTFPVPMSCLSPEDIADAVSDAREAMDKGRGQGVPALATDEEIRFFSQLTGIPEATSLRVREEMDQIRDGSAADTRDAIFAPHELVSHDWRWKSGRSGLPKDSSAFQRNVISANLMQHIRELGSICSDCAQKHGGAWPEGHVATFSVSKCGVCEEEKACADRSDWNFSWIELRPMEREF